MNLTLLGATGNLGPYLLEQLLAHGHSVRVLARRPEAVKVRHARLEVVPGDVRSPADVTAALEGQEAIVNSVGGTFDSDIRRVTVSNILDALRDRPGFRLINLCGAGLLSIGPLYLYQMPGFPAAMRAVSKEHRRVFDLIRRSPLKWTIVCPPTMNDEVNSGNYQLRANRPIWPPAKTINLADVAHFIAKTVSEDSFVGARVSIAPAK